MRRPEVLLPVLLLAALLTVGCASGGSAGASSGSSGNLVTMEELADYEDGDLLRALRQLRPRWLRQRTGSGLPVVLLDGTRFGDINRLRDIAVSSVDQVRYRDGRDATMRYGTGYGGGVIEVSSRRR